MSNQERLNGETWREILERENTEAKDKADKEQLTKLSIMAGDWAITFLDDGTPYTFERQGETKHGIAFLVNAKHLTSGGNFPNVKWNVTAKRIKRLLMEQSDLTGCVLKLTVTGSGIQTRYPDMDLAVPKKRKA
jgi:hypothetical protein